MVKQRYSEVYCVHVSSRAVPEFGSSSGRNPAFLQIRLISAPAKIGPDFKFCRKTPGLSSTCENRDTSSETRIYQEHGFSSEYYQVLITNHLPTPEGWKAELAWAHHDCK